MAYPPPSCSKNPPLYLLGAVPFEKLVQFLHNTLTITLLNFYSIFCVGKFDFIECRHVVEHLVDPLKGLHLLTSLLKQDGAISLTLHAE